MVVRRPIHCSTDNQIANSVTDADWRILSYKVESCFYSSVAPGRSNLSDSTTI